MVSVLFLGNYRHLYASGNLQTATRSTSLSGKGEMGLLVWEQSLFKQENKKAMKLSLTSEVTNMVG